MKLLIIIIFLAIVSNSNINPQSQIKLHPFSNFGKNSLKCFSGANLAFHGGGILATYLIINSGLDYKVHNYFVENGYSSFFDPAVGIGYILPVVIGGGLYLFGNTENISKEKAAGSAVLQAVIISVAYSSVLKAATGRPNPSPEAYIDAEGSKKFLFGFFRGGIHYGWPSGHLCTNTAVVSALISFYKKNTAVKAAGVIYLGYLFYGVAAHDNNTMHWFSDIVSGFLMGYAIGSTVGKNFRDEWDKTNLSSSYTSPDLSPGLMGFSTDGSNYLTLSPVVNKDYTGININLSF